MNKSNIRFIVLSLAFVLVWAGSAQAVKWDFVYEADVFPLADNAITDANCVGILDDANDPAGAFDFTASSNTTLNDDGTVTIDDANSAVANVFMAQLLDGFWSITEPITVEMRVKFVPTPQALGDSYVFLSVNNHSSGFSYGWYIDYDWDANSVFILGDWDSDPNDPNNVTPEELQRLDFGEDPGWIRLRVNVSNNSVLPLLWAWDESGTPGVNPIDPNVTSSIGYRRATSTSNLSWGDLWSTENEGAMTWDYIRWLIGAEYGPDVEIDDPEPCPCGAWGYAQSDFNSDCGVSLLDYADLTAAWGGCTDPTDANCTNLYAQGVQTAEWEYMYECDDLPGVTGVIKDANYIGAGQWSGSGAISSPDPCDIVTVSGGILDINDLGFGAVGNNHYCLVDDTTVMWDGPGSTVEIRMKYSTEGQSVGNTMALQVSDGTNYYRWYIGETVLTGVGAISIDMTQMQTLRVAWPEAGTPTLYVDYGGIQSLAPYTNTYSTPAALTFGDQWSDESGHFSYDYVRWTTQGAYDMLTVMSLP